MALDRGMDGRPEIRPLGAVIPNPFAIKLGSTLVGWTFALCDPIDSPPADGGGNLQRRAS